MTDLELYHKMRSVGFTENGASLAIEIKNEYEALYPYYDEFMGNFGFNQKEVEHLMPLILKFISKHSEYVLLFDNEPYENNCVWWLTTQY